MSASKNILPPAPSGLCFSKDEFIKENFEVDKFLHDCRKRASPETLRDDLRIYHKILQNALVELINNDYADFVNLSSNLAGMDRLIGNLSLPLEGFQSEIVQVQAQMTATIDAINQKLQEKAAIRQARACLTRLAGVVRSVDTIDRMLKSSADGAGDAKATARVNQGSVLDGQLVERVAGEYNKLLCYLSELESNAPAATHAEAAGVKAAGYPSRPRFPLLATMQPRIDSIGETVRQRLGALMVSALQSKSVDALARCLRSYAAIDRAHEAETLFGQCVVRPLCDQIIQENRLLQPQQQQQHHALGFDVDALADMYAELMETLPPTCALLADVASGKRGADAIEGYDFAVNGVWPEVADAIEKRLSLIFAPGDPDAFFKRYTATLDFIDRFEQRCCCTVSSVRRLRAHAAYSTFIGKWNVPVYFQIRLQEVTGSVEAALETPFACQQLSGGEPQPAAEEGGGGGPGTAAAAAAVDASVFTLQALRTAWCAVRHCWAPDVYVGAAAHRFWKLTLQIVARLATWLADTEQMKAAVLRKKESVRTAVDDAGSATAAAAAGAGTDSASSAAASSLASGASSGPPAAAASAAGAVGQLICLVADCLKFTSAVRGFFAQVISRRLLEAGVPQQSLQTYQGCLDQSCAAVDTNAEAYAAVIVDDVLQQSAPCLRLITDIPRLYRKTNREVPAKPSSYVAGLVKPLADFVLLTSKEAAAGDTELSARRGFLPQHVESRIVSQVLAELCRQYESTATEVLTSVKKMEDSLKRLKRGKGPATAGTASTTSDDDKIRLQLALDIDAFSTKISELKVVVDDVPSFSALRSAGTAAAAAVSSAK